MFFVPLLSSLLLLLLRPPFQPLTFAAASTLSYSSLYSNTSCFTQWQTTFSNYKWLALSHRTQRDLGWNNQRTPWNTIRLPAVDLFQLYSNWDTASPSTSPLQTVPTVRQLLELGYRRYHVDLWWTGTTASDDNNWKECRSLTNSSVTGLKECRPPTTKDESILQSLSSWLQTTTAPAQTSHDPTATYKSYKELVVVVLRLNLLNPSLSSPTTAVSRQSAIQALLQSGSIFTPSQFQRLNESLSSHQVLSGDRIINKTRTTSEGLLFTLVTQSAVYNMTTEDQSVFFPTEQLDPISLVTRCNPQPNLTQSISARVKFDSRLTLPPAMELSNETCITDEQMASSCMDSPLVVDTISVLRGSEATVWSWALDEPASGLQCATLRKDGRWRADDCSKQYYAACLSSSDNYNWTLSLSTSTFTTVKCPSGYTFDVPRSPQENLALSLYLLQTAPSLTIWLNYSDLQYAGCWVIGKNACPYFDEDSAYLQIITVSAGAGIMILLLGLLFAYYRHRRYKETRRAYYRKDAAIRRLDTVDLVAVPA